LLTSRQRRIAPLDREVILQTTMHNLPSESDARLLAAAEAGRMGVWDYDFVTGQFTASAKFKQNLGLAADDELSWERF
jgi:hypothetical protein